MRANPKKHSFSRIKTFLQCERCHAWDALKPKVETAAARRGSVVHDAIENVVKLMLDHYDAHRACDKVVEAAGKNMKKVGNYLARLEPVLKGLEPYAAEKWFDRDPDLPHLVGKIDCLSKNTPLFDNGVFTGKYLAQPCIIDWKTTGSSAYVLTEQGAQENLQPQIYSIVEGLTTGCFIYMLPSGPPIGVPVEYETEKLALTKRWLQGIMKTIDGRWYGAASSAFINHEETRGFDLSVFAAAPPDSEAAKTPWLRHEQLCLKGDTIWQP